MSRSFSLFLALRYLKPKQTFLSIITLISILGVTLGIMVMIVVISVMSGFEHELQDKIVGFDAHLVVLGNNDVITDWQSKEKLIEETNGVVAAAPFVFGPVVAEFQNRRMVPKIRGVEPDPEAKVTNIANCIVEGKFDLNGDNAVIGTELARSLGAKIGDKITVYSPGNLNELMQHLDDLEKSGSNKRRISDIKQAILPRDVTVTGLFKTGRYLYDSEIMFVPLFLGQELYGLGDSVHGLTIKTSDPYNASVTEAALKPKLPGLLVQTWMEQNEQLFRTIRVERMTQFVILLIVTVVAAFCVMNTLITVTVLKTREIGILKALGADVSQVVKVFLAQGMAVGAIGVVTGIAAGLGVLAVRNPFKDWLARQLGIQLFPPGIYQFDQIPALTQVSDVITISVSAFIICSLAALIPAYFAARLDPVKALRFE